MVFEDPSRRRWRIAVASFMSVAFFGLVLFSLSAAAIMTDPTLPQMTDITDNARAALRIKQVTVLTDKISQPRTKAQWQNPDKSYDRGFLVGAAADSVPLTSLAKTGEGLRTAFLLQQDSNSVRSFRQNAENLDAVFPDWFFLSRTDCRIDERINPDVTGIMKNSGVGIIARVTDGEGGKSYAAEAGRVLRDPVMRKCVADKVVERAAANGAIGVLVDMETLSPGDANAYLGMLAEFKRAAHEQSMMLVAAIPAGSQAYHTEAVAVLADAVLVIMHGESYAASGPGPLASQAWFEEAMNHFTGIIPKDKLIVGIGSYGLDWALTPTGTATGLTYDQAMSTASEAGALPGLSAKARNMTFGYQDASGRTHNVWFLDAVTTWNEWKRISEAGVLGVALWRLGSEDPNIWTFLGKAKPTVAALSSVPALNGVHNPTQAEIYRIQADPMAGSLRVVQDKEGMIIDARYTEMPTGYILDRVGSVPSDKTLVLAFYNGPDPNWTPSLMDVLDENNVPATFFVVGNQAEKYPSLLQDMARRGHLLGNYGYQFGDQNVLAMDQLKSDVNATQRLIENASNRHSRLFGVPAPITSESAAKLQSISELGYVLVSPSISLNSATSRDEEAIANDIKSQIKGPGKHVIALQNDGSDQTALVAALKRLLPELKQDGYQFLRMDQAIGLNDSELQPAYGAGEAVFVGTVNIVNTLRNLFWPIMFWVFLLTTIFAMLRIVFMSIYVIRSARHKRRLEYRAPQLIYASVLIPAYNEQETILKTLESLQTSKHRRFEALVIDDGSTDRTGEIVREFVKSDPRFRLLQKSNGGKSTALNMGMRMAKYDIVVTIDADTILFPNAIDEMIKPFADPKVDAVCGNVEVGNVHNMLTGFQALEYITAQNFDRRAFEELNAISVVPGATGAWRRKRVLDIGGYETDTLTEDADMTIKMLVNNGKIVYAPNAKSITEAPDKMRDLAKQRFRWSFGTFQCLGKYTNQFFKGRVGWIALPNIFIFQIIFPLLAPLGDILFVVALVRGDFSLIFYSYIFFTLLDVVGSVFAFVLEHKPKRLMLFVLIQRFFYRQFLYITILRAILAILRGRRYGWNKLKRTGTVLATGTQ